MRKEFRAKLNGDDSRADASASFTLPFDTRDVWSKTKVPVKVAINDLPDWAAATDSGVDCIW